VSEQVCGVATRHGSARALLCPLHNNGEVVMNHCHEPTWFRKMLVLSALVAGSVATLFVPPYREVAFIPEDREAVTTPGSSSRGMTGIDVNLHHRNLVQSNG
jgi:hypothetical protein